MAGAKVREIERLVQPTGFYRNKAKAIHETSKILVEKYDGKVPRTLDELARMGELDNTLVIFTSDNGGIESLKNAYVGTVPEFAKVGGRIATIVKAADPLKSLQTLPQRITVLPITDPSLAAIVAEMNATP